MTFQACIYGVTPSPSSSSSFSVSPTSSSSPYKHPRQTNSNSDDKPRRVEREMKPKGGQITHTPLSRVIHTTDSPLNSGKPPTEHKIGPCRIGQFSRRHFEQFTCANCRLFFFFFRDLLRRCWSYILVERGTNSTPHLLLRFLQEMKSEGGSPLPQSSIPRPSEFTANWILQRIRKKMANKLFCFSSSKRRKTFLCRREGGNKAFDKVLYSYCLVRSYLRSIHEYLTSHILKCSVKIAARDKYNCNSYNV